MFVKTGRRKVNCAHTHRYTNRLNFFTIAERTIKAFFVEACRRWRSSHSFLEKAFFRKERFSFAFTISPETNTFPLVAFLSIFCTTIVIRLLNDFIVFI